MQASIALVAGGERLGDDDARALAETSDLAPLLEAARALRDRSHATVVSYSPKVFIPLTKLCRDVCHYCTFATTPRNAETPYLSISQMVDIARAGARAGCHEALFTLGDKPELRYRAAREALTTLRHDSTLGFLAAAAKAVHEQTGLLPHLNPGVMSRDELARLRPVSVSSGMMLESVSVRLTEKGGPHYGSPDKHPKVRLATLRAAGELAVPFTSGILIGIGETRRERIDSLLTLRALHERYGHIQEVIVQNFRAKAGTVMAQAPEPSLDEHLWTIAVARLILGPEMNIQAPPNLRLQSMEKLIEAGINDWGGVSPVTCDHVNPEAPWPALERLRRVTEGAGKQLVPRLPVYPHYAREPERWLDAAMRTPVLRRIDAHGYAIENDWAPGANATPDKAERALVFRRPGPALDASTRAILARAQAGDDLRSEEIVHLFGARGRELNAVCRAADALRERASGDTVGYVVNRNINYTNVCYFKCRFCAFSKGRNNEDLRGAPYDLALDEIARRVTEAWARGAVEVCMQGGIHPRYTGDTYLSILERVKQAVPLMHVHAFSPLEVWQGAHTLGLSLDEYLQALKAAGLGSLPGTAAEVLDDEVRAVICPDKISTAQWLAVMEAAHRIGLSSTATIMFGHVDEPIHWARHLVRMRTLQQRTGGFTEFVPLPFVHMEAPIYRRGRARRGPTFREAVLMHAVGRLVLQPYITNIQTSWVKMGPEGAAVCLSAGANDLGGTLMNESITRAAGAAHGEELPPEQMEALIAAAGRSPKQRATLYGEVSAERRRASFAAKTLQSIVNTPMRRAGAAQVQARVRFGTE